MLSEKVERFRNFDRSQGELFFCIGFIIILFRGMWLSTMFPQNRLLSTLCIPIAALFIGLKILICDHYSVKQMVLAASVVICTMLSCYYSRTVNAFILILLVFGSRDIEFEKILKMYLAVVGTLMVLAFVASQIGIIENLQYVQRGRIRNSFGIIYPTDFASHVFYCMTAIFYLMRNKLKIIYYVIAIGVAGLLYYFCDTRLDSLSILLVAFLFGMENVMEHTSWIKEGTVRIWRAFWQKIGVYSMPLAAITSIGITLLYRDSNLLWIRLDEFLTHRLGLGKNMYDAYGIRLFGQDIEMVGLGGTTAEYIPDYNFVDCSYMYVLLMNGILFLIILMVLYVQGCKRRKQNVNFLNCIIIVSLNCMIAHHILQIEYNIWLLCVLTSDQYKNS